MRAESTTLEDRSASVVPAIVATHPDDVRSVRALADYRVHVEFYDGTSGIVDLARMILSPRAGVFADLADPDIFEQVAVVYGAVTWPGDLDLEPDAMYAELRAHGTWTLE